MGRSYLVTGGAGFVGSHIVEALVRRGDRVRVLDDFSTGSRETLRALGRVELLEGDVRDAATVGLAVADIDGVFHQAALGAVDDPLRTNDVNVTGTLTLLTACQAAGVRRLVFASSATVYGDDPTLPKVETMPTAPSTAYAVSKLAAEHYCRTFAKCYGVETVCIRPFTVFGPRQTRNAGVVPRFVAQALNGDPLEIHGDGQQSRDFTYVDDVVLGNLLAMDTPGVSGEVFNVACNARHSVLAIADAIGSFLGRKLERRHEPAHARDVRHTLADIGKAERLLGYAPKVGFADGMRRTCEFFLQRFRPTGHAGATLTVH